MPVVLRAVVAATATATTKAMSPPRPPHQPPHPTRVDTLVVSGGGMKGVASLGAVVALKKAGALRHVTTVVGTSAGALVAAALATDRASSRLVDDLAASQYRADLDLGRLLGTFGLDSGKQLESWIEVLLGGGDPTFGDVWERHGVRLVVCATNVTRRRPEYFSVDTTPGMRVALALRMSCAIPLYFSAVTHEGCVYVDGAVSDNFPVAWAASRAGSGGVLGIAFEPRASDPRNSFEDFVGALLECSTRRNYDALPVGGKGGGGARRTAVIMLDTGARSAFELTMSAKDMKKLYLAGARQTRAWVKKRV